MEIEKEIIITEEKSKIWPTVFSWGFFLLSLIVSTFVPGVKENIPGIRIIRIFKDAITRDYRETFLLVGFLVSIFLIMYLIDFLRKKFLGYAPPPDATLKELEKGLRSFRVIFETWRIYAVILGAIILVASLFGISMR